MSFNSAYDDSTRSIRVTTVGGAGSGGSSFSTGVYNSTATAYNSGASIPMQMDSAGNQKVTEATLLAGEDLVNNLIRVNQVFSYQALTSLVTVLVKSGAGFLHSLVVGNMSGPTIEIYDSLTASGTLIGRINANCPAQTYIFDVAFTTGLTLNPQPGNALLPNASASWR